MATYEWWKEQERLWNKLVPRSGQARTVQGEIVRCAGRLTDEAYRNGNCNWEPGSGHELMLDYIEQILLGDGTFAPERQIGIKKDVEEIRDYEHPNVGGHGSCYYNLTEAVVDWCMAHPEPIPREINPDLKR